MEEAQKVLGRSLAELYEGLKGQGVPKRVAEEICIIFVARALSVNIPSPTSEFENIISGLDELKDQLEKEIHKQQDNGDGEDLHAIV